MAESYKDYLKSLTSESRKIENYLQDIEELTDRYYNDDWSYSFDFDKGLHIHLPIEE